MMNFLKKKACQSKPFERKKVLKIQCIIVFKRNARPLRTKIMFNIISVRTAPLVFFAAPLNLLKQTAHQWHTY